MILPANEIEIPDGDYKQSCGGCRIQRENFLSEARPKYLLCSHCTKTCGKHVESSLDLSSCKSEDGDIIFNQDGNLKCEDPLPSNQDNLPYGSFSSSCYGCSLSGSLLSCSACIDDDRVRRSSSIDLNTCRYVGNVMGHLTCEDDRVIGNEDGYDVGPEYDSAMGLAYSESGHGEAFDVERSASLSTGRGHEEL